VDLQLAPMALENGAELLPVRQSPAGLDLLELAVPQPIESTISS
jgi:hypothetical protein